MDLGEFQDYLLDKSVEMVTIRVPIGDEGWIVNFRQGPGWACGNYCKTLTEAVETSLANYRRAWGDKMKAAKDLTDLLG